MSLKLYEGGHGTGKNRKKGIWLLTFQEGETQEILYKREHTHQGYNYHELNIIAKTAMSLDST